MKAPQRGTLAGSSRHCRAEVTRCRADRDTRIVALRALAERAERSPDPGYRAYQRRLIEYNCACSARIHNATTSDQRRLARETLKGWEDDLRALREPSAAVPAPIEAPA